MAKRVHHVTQLRTGIDGIEAMTMLTEHVFPRHAHDQYGIGVMTLGAQKSWSVVGQVESEVGDVIMVNPGEIHDGAPIERVRGWHILYLDPSLLVREMAEGSTASDLVIRPVARDPQLASSVVRLFEELKSTTRDGMLVEEILLGCLLRVVQRHDVDGIRKTRPSPPVARAVECLASSPAVQTSLAELAALSDMSRFQLLRGFFREIGATPHAYLVQLRVRLARRYLAAGCSPAEAALLAGFADQSHLTRAFVRQFGVTPGRYKAAIS